MEVRQASIIILLVECRTLEGEPERSAYVCACRACKEQLHSHDCHQNVTRLSSECDQAISTEIMALITLVHITATVSQVSVYSLAATSLSVSPRRKNVHGALANVHEWSPSLLSPSFVEQVTGS